MPNLAPPPNSYRKVPTDTTDPRGIPATIPENFPATACTIENLSVPLRLRNYSEPEDSFSKGKAIHNLLINNV